jgi:hypothetical protein
VKLEKARALEALSAAAGRGTLVQWKGQWPCSCSTHCGGDGDTGLILKVQMWGPATIPKHSGQSQSS